MAGMMLSSCIYAQNQFLPGFGTVYGGAIPTDKIEDASGRPRFGLMLDAAYAFPLGQNIRLLPGISVEVRRFGYVANEKNDTMVLVDILGSPANIPTYYRARIEGNVSSTGITLNLPAEYKFIKRSSLLFGAYATRFIKKNDQVAINVRIGEGSLLPDVDSTYSNRANMRDFEYGISLGGRLYISENLSLAITGTRSLVDLYAVSGIKNKEGHYIRFYSTYAKVFLTWHFSK